MRAWLPILLSSALTAHAAGYAPPATDRSWTDLSGQAWKFTGSNSLTGAEASGFDDASWQMVRVPHTWNTKANLTTYSNAWYRTHVQSASADTAGGKRFYLYFEGANDNADVYLNGTLLGRHQGGYTAFIFDATAARKDGDNVLAVKVDNATHPGLPSNGNGWVHYGGLFRKVRILATNRYSIDPTDFASPGVYISQSKVSSASANLSVRVMLRNSGPVGKTLAVNLMVCDSTDGIVTTLRDSLAVPANSDTSLVLNGTLASPHLWSLGAPYLYRIYTELRVDGAIKDMVAQRTGFRSYQLTTSSFTINGEQKLLRGAGMHAENEASYNALDSAAVRKQFDVAQDMGMNYLRLVHYPHATAAYNLADERGIGLSTEDGLYQNQGDVRSAVRDGNAREMVMQNFNHPSILWWGAGNEDYYAPNTTEFAAIIKAADTTRPVVYASSGQNPPGVDFIFQNIYQGWYSGAIKDFPAGNHWISETGAGGVIASHQSYKATTFTVGTFEPEEYESLVLEHKFQYLFKTKPSDVPLYSHWVLFDIADTKYKGLNTKGLFTAAGFPKDPAYLWKALARPNDPLIRICGKHWYVRTATRDVKVYSNRPSITLSVNGAAKGTKADGAYTNPSTGGVINDVFYFDSVLVKGRNTVIASDGAGKADTAVLYFEGSAPAAPADPAEPVTQLTSSSATNPAYFVNSPVQPQWPAYYQCDGNADNSFDTIPALLADAGWIATRRQSLDPSTLSFTVQSGQGADVYVMMTKQASVPAWITSAGLTPSGISGRWRDNAMNLVDYEVYGKTFPAGASVKLGGTSVDFVAMVKAAGRTGIRKSERGIPAASGYRFLSAAKRIPIPLAAAGASREIVIYDLSGKCLRKAMLRGNEALFDAGDAIGEGLHIIQVRMP
ncbi:MAG: beta galactosidase jelly roll domain-containing protein [Fibrobacteres bacterium]|nr:beta galactosidase jelly roll domain-containing protein [Fibrobacterota bacterium]